MRGIYQTQEVKKKESKPKKGIMSLCVDTQENIHMCL